MFKQGDFIKVKENTQLETGEIVQDWRGEIIEVFEDEKTCLIGFDAQTLDSLDDAYLKSCIEEGEESFGYIFRFDELELSTSRSSDEEIMKSLDRLAIRVSVMEEEMEKEMAEEEERREQVWMKEFERSKFFEKLNKSQKEDAEFIVDTFMDFMHNYQGVQPEEWTPSDVRIVCIEIVPRKVIDKIDFFKNYGDVLIQYFNFIGNENYISNSKVLIQTVESIKDEIVIEASNPDNWGMSKAMLMSAQDQGFDLSNEADLEKILMLQQSQILEERRQGKIIPLSPDPFKGIGRNQKITVKYKNGKILETIKFKKVEKDLRNGDCEII